MLNCGWTVTASSSLVVGKIIPELKDSAFGKATVRQVIVLGWVIARTTGKSVPSLLSERIWSRMGAEQSGYMTVHPQGDGLCRRRVVRRIAGPGPHRAVNAE